MVQSTGRLVGVAGLLVLLLLPCAGEARTAADRDTAIRLDYYDLTDQLPGGESLCILEDSIGMMWIGTRSGLVRYDAEEFHVYYPSPEDSTAMAEAMVMAICERRFGEIWVVNPGNVACLNTRTGKFKNYPMPDTLEQYRSLYVSWGMVVDRQGELWVFGEHCVGRYDQGRDQFEFRPHELGHPGVSAVYQIEPQLGQGDGVWVNINGSLYLFHTSSWTFDPLPQMVPQLGLTNATRVKSLSMESNGSLWISAGQGLFLRRPTSDTLQPIPLPTVGTGGKRVSPVAVRVDGEGSIWCAMNVGLGRFSLSDSTWMLANKFYGGRDLRMNDTLTLCVSRGGDLWIPIRNGLGRMGYRPRYFQELAYAANGDYFFNGMRTSSLLTRDDSILWVGSWDRGITRFNLYTGVRMFYGLDVPSHPLPSKEVYRLAFLHDSTMVASLRGHFYYYDPARDQWKDYFVSQGLPGVSRQLKKLFLLTFYQQSNGDIWFGTSVGLYHYSDSARQLSAVTGLGHVQIFSVTDDGRGTLWLGSNYGIYSYHPGRNELLHFPISGRDTLTSQAYSYIAACSQRGASGIVWFGTNVGLYALPPGARRPQLVRERINQHSNQIYSLQEDRLGMLWLGTECGLAVYDPLVDSLVLFDAHDGLVAQDYSLNAYCRSPNGHMYFGGLDGVVHFDGTQLHPAPPKPLVMVHECFGLSEGPAELIPLRSDNLLEVEAKYSTVTLSLAMLRFDRRARPVYEYRVPGIADQWMPVFSGHLVTLGGLPEGMFTFEYRCPVGQGSYAYGTPLKIVIRKPLLVSRGAKVIYLLLGLLAVSIYAVSRWIAYHELKEAVTVKEQAVQEATRQKWLVEERNQELRSSLQYAYLMQKQLVAGPAVLANYLQDYFLLFRPRDIVGGDFCWAARHAQTILLAVVDCTGHGAPAAMMSVMATIFLDRIVNQLHEYSPKAILAVLNTMILEQWRRDAQGDLYNDGLDITLCAIHTDTQRVTVAGAFQKLYHIGAAGVRTYSGDRIFTGGTPHAVYREESFIYAPDDMLYLLSDGFADQFGGNSHKRYGADNLQQLLLTVSVLPTAQQLKQLETTLSSWQAGGAQVDDITVLGVRCRF